jgi:UDP-N-acetyl-D-glucosamine dehydrogenase
MQDKIMNKYIKIINMIKNNKENVCITGLGYVGLTLAVTYARNEVQVLSFEESTKKADNINKSDNYIDDVTDSDLVQAVEETEKLSATTVYKRIKECEAVIICVPTSLDHLKTPDMLYIEGSCIDIGQNMKIGTFISLERTPYPATTLNLIKPIIEKESRMKEGGYFWLYFTPERVDPGNIDYKTVNTLKAFGALGEKANEIAIALYFKAIKHLHTVSNPRAAEMVKILENTYKLINISLIYELTLLSDKIDINIWEVMEAVKSKLYRLQAFYTGPRIGGHFIPLGPFYLEHIAKNYNFYFSMIHTAGAINYLRPYSMMNKIAFALNRQKEVSSSFALLWHNSHFISEKDCNLHENVLKG